jgi:hypothetical protein
VVELYSLWQKGARFVKDPGPKDRPLAQMLFLVLHGQVLLDTAGIQMRLSAPPGPALAEWDSSFGMDKAPQYLKELPPWATRAGQQRSDEEKAKYRAARDLLQKVSAEKGIDAAVNQLLASDEPIDRRIGIIVLGALDDVEKIGPYLKMAKYPDLVDTGTMVLRHWIGRGPGQDQRFYQSLI